MTSKKERALTHSFWIEERKERKRVRRMGRAEKQRFAAWA
jgi:hypothetical protein